MVCPRVGTAILKALQYLTRKKVFSSKVESASRRPNKSHGLGLKTAFIRSIGKQRLTKFPRFLVKDPRHTHAMVKMPHFVITEALPHLTPLVLQCAETYTLLYFQVICPQVGTAVPKALQYLTLKRRILFCRDQSATRWPNKTHDLGFTKNNVSVWKARFDEIPTPWGQGASSCTYMRS